MSHTTEVSDIVFKDIGALTAAVKELQAAGVKCSLAKGGTPRAYFSTQQGMGPADYVLKLDGSPYDVGFYMDAAKGGMIARTDIHAGHVAKQIGAKVSGTESATQGAMGRLYQTYAIHAATRQAAKQGYSVRRINKPDGSVSLVMNVQ